MSVEQRVQICRLIEKMKFQHCLLNAECNSGIAITSDGPEHLMFQLSDMKPGKIFDMLLDDLAKEELCKQDLMDYLTRREWDNDPRGTDDRSLALLTCIKTECCAVPDSWEELLEPEKESVTPAGSVEVKPEEMPETPAEPVETETNPEDTPLQRNEPDCDCDTPCDCTKKKPRSFLTPVFISGLAITVLAETSCLVEKQQTIVHQKQQIECLSSQLAVEKAKQKPTPAPEVKPTPAPEVKPTPAPEVKQTQDKSPTSTTATGVISVGEETSTNPAESSDAADAGADRDGQ